MTRGLVSVIIPAFNAAAYIRETLNSVLAQTYRALEVIVVDDGSEDGTDSIAEEFVKRDARVQLVRQCNSGVGAARNMAIRMARGEYIAPMDADDMWFPEKLEKQVACMEHYGEETGLVYCWFTRVDKDGAFERFPCPSAAEGRVRHAMVSGNIVGNGSVPLLRTAALARVGLYHTRAEQRGAQGCEDWDLYIRIAESFSIRLVPEFLVAYRRTTCSMSVNAESMAASFEVVILRARQRNPDLPTATFRHAAGNFYVYLAGICERWNHDSWSFRYLKNAICANPSFLLESWPLKKFIKISLRAISSSTWKFLKQIRLSSENEGKEADLHYKKDKECSFVSKAILESIELSRLSALRGQD
jgi:glycosyltransferase involved in cell wall biosynthesis